MSEARSRSVRQGRVGRSCAPVSSTQQGNVAPKPTRERTQSKSKIPKNMRYDLEDALLSLCDVWFDNIKPYLVQNNIKLHVHGGAGPSSPSADGDHRPRSPQPSRCRHQDPGAASDVQQQASASCVACCSEQRPASRTRCGRRRGPAAAAGGSEPRLARRRTVPARGRSPPPPARCAARRRSTPLTVPPLTLDKQKLQPRSPVPAPVAGWSAPRRCRTYSVLSPEALRRTLRDRRTADLPPACNNLLAGWKNKSAVAANVKKPAPRPRSPQTKNNSTQTTFQNVPSAMMNQVGCKKCELCGRSTVRVRTGADRVEAGDSGRDQRRNKQPRVLTAPQQKQPSSKSVLKPDKEFGSQQTKVAEKPLFPPDLIEIIAQKSLVCLYQSPRPTASSALSVTPRRHRAPRRPPSPRPWR